MMRLVGIAAIAIVGFVFGCRFLLVEPAHAYEDCAVNSYAHCMSCGAKYGYTGATQTRFCANHGFPPPEGGKKKRS